MKPDVVAAFATDHKFRYYTGVALHTLAEHASAETRYEILILADSPTPEDKAFFARILAGKANFSLRVLEMREKIAELGEKNFYTGSYSIANYYRLFLHEMLPEYGRVLYLDSDIVVQADVRELFETDLCGFALGAMKDFGPTRLKQYAYIRNTLKLERPGGYFNSGVLLMDLEKLRSSEFSRQVRENISSGLSFKWVDQDVLNRIFDGRIRYLDPAWNYMALPGKHPERKKILHFPGVKPWFSETNPAAAPWWDAAGKTFFVQDMKKEVYASPERIKFLEDRESAYYAVLHSTCWFITAPMRWIIDTVKLSKELLKAVISGRN